MGLRAIVNDMPDQFPDDELRRLATLLTEGTIDCRHLMFCADDVHPNRLLAVGGVDAAVRRAVRCGVPWPTAVRMATINVASHYRVDHLFGSLAPGRVADIVILDDPTTFEVATVIADGRQVSALSSASAPARAPAAARSYPSWAYQTVHLERPLVADDFRLPAPAGAGDGDEVHVTAIFPGLARQGRLLPGTEKQERRPAGPGARPPRRAGRQPATGRWRR